MLIQKQNCTDKSFKKIVELFAFHFTGPFKNQKRFYINQAKLIIELTYSKHNSYAKWLDWTVKFQYKNTS